MKKEMLINVLQSEECRIAILENGLLEELYVERANQESLVGNIYKGKIVNIEPSIQAAFVDFGVGRNGFLHISDVEPIYWRLAENKGRLPELERPTLRPERTPGDRPAGDRPAGDRPTGDRPTSDRGPRSERPALPATPMNRPAPAAPTPSAPAPATAPAGFDAGIDGDLPPLSVSVVVPPPIPASASARPASPPPPVTRPQTAPPAAVPMDFLAGIELDEDLHEVISPLAEGETDEDNNEPLMAAPGTEIQEEEPTRPRRKRTTTRKKKPKSDETGENCSDDETPRPRPMDSAERRTDDGSDPPIDDDLLFFPNDPVKRSDEEPVPAPAAARVIPLAEPILPPPLPEAESLPVTPPPLPVDAIVIGEAPPRRTRPVDMPRSVEAALEEDLAAAEVEGEDTPGVILDASTVEMREPDSERSGRNDPRREPRRDREPRREREPRRGERDPRRDSPREPEREQRGTRHEPEPPREREVAASFEDDLDDCDDEGFSRRSNNDRADRGERRGSRDSRSGGRSFGGGGDRFASRPGAGRPRPPIQDVFKRGQEVIVQVIKEGIGTKGPTLSTFISIPGRYLVLMPYLNRTGVSRKIEDEDARRRLRQMFNELRPPQGLGFIMRTAAIDKNKREVQRDLVYLSRLWQVIANRIKKVKAPCNIYQESEMVTRTIRDNFTSDIDTIWIDEPHAFEAAQEFMQAVMPRFADRLKFYDSKEPLFHKFKIEDELARIQLKKIPLPQGGSIVIEQTEALVAIDVNSGNFRADGNNAEETAFQMNLNAAKEIARQLRLRDLGGVIVNDFIDMRDEKHRRAVERALRDAMKRDRARTKILRISQFGIIEMTRQRIRPGLKRAGYVDCPHCKGHGMVKSPETLAIEIMRMLQLASCREPIHQVEITAAPEVADYLLNRRRRELIQLEESGNMTVLIRAGIGVAAEHLHFVCLDHNGNEVRLIAPEPLPIRPRR
jgi:ribonuclease E